jgi:hypothetical protein
VRRISAHRLAGATFVLALHVAIALLLLHAIHAPRRSREGRELILTLAPLPLAPRPVLVPHASPPSVRATTPVFAIPPSATAPQYVDPKALESFGRALFDCRPETIANLAPEQRAQCETRGLKPRDAFDFADHTARSRDAALWSRDRARKRAPLLLPCASSAGVGVGLGTLACLGDGLVGGFDPRKQDSYGDAHEQEAHVPNNGDPRPAYVDPYH